MRKPLFEPEQRQQLRAKLDKHEANVRANIADPIQLDIKLTEIAIRRATLDQDEQIAANIAARLQEQSRQQAEIAKQEAQRPARQPSRSSAKWSYAAYLAAGFISAEYISPIPVSEKVRSIFLDNGNTETLAHLNKPEVQEHLRHNLLKLKLVKGHQGSGCSAGILDTRHMISAAHCVGDATDPFSLVEINKVTYTAAPYIKEVNLWKNHDSRVSWSGYFDQDVMVFAFDKDIFDSNLGLKPAPQPLGPGSLGFIGTAMYAPPVNTTGTPKMLYSGSKVAFGHGNPMYTLCFNMVIEAGNSGSPMVNTNGEVISVLRGGLGTYACGPALGKGIVDNLITEADKVLKRQSSTTPRRF